MSSGVFFLETKSDLPIALEFADRGFAIAPLTSQAQQALAEGAASISSVADEAVQSAVLPSQEDAELMADQMLETIAALAPEMLRYRGLDLTPALFQSTYQTLTLGIAFARRIVSLVGEQAGRTHQQAAFVDERPLSETVRRMLEDMEIEVLPIRPRNVTRTGPLEPLKTGKLRTVVRDVPLLARSLPPKASAELPRVALVATGRTHPSLCSEVLQLLQDDFAIEMYGTGFVPEAPEGVRVHTARKLDDYSARTAGATASRRQYYRAGLRALDSIMRALPQTHWRGTDTLVGTTLPVTMDRATYITEQSLNFARSANPDLVIMMDERSLISRLVTAACAIHSIPTLDLQHGMFVADPGLRDVSYDKFAVFGEATKRVLMDWGVEESHIEITGCPRFDTVRSKPAPSRDQILSAHGLDPNGPVVLAATQPIKNTMTMGAKRLFVKGVVDGVRSGRYQLLLKKHPYEKDTLAEQLSAGMTNVAVTSQGDVADLVSVSDAVATISSTVGFESLVIGRPLVVFREDWMSVPFPFGFEGVADIADRRGLAPALEKAVKMDRAAVKAKSDSYLTGYVRLDGDSAQRIAGLVRGMARA